MYFVLAVGFIVVGVSVHCGLFVVLGVFVLLAAIAASTHSVPLYRPLSGEPQYHLIKCDEFLCTKCGTTWHRREVGIRVPNCESCGSPRIRKASI